MPPHARIVHGEGVFPAGRLFRLLGSALALAATPTTATIAATVTSTTTASSTRGRGLFCLGAGGAGFAPCIHGRGCSGRSSKSGHNRRLHTRLHRLQARRLVQIVKVFTVTGWQPLGPAREHGQPLHSLGSGFGLFAAWVTACACLRGAVIVPTHGQQGGRQQRPHGLGHVQQVARVKGHHHGPARGLVQAGRCGVALSHQHNGSAGQMAQHMPQAGLAPAL